MRSQPAARISLGVLCLNCLALGALAAFAPRTFFDDFPFFAHWVERLPPYNQHLVSDVGGLYLGFAVILAWAVWRPGRELVLAASTGFLTVAVLHFGFHVSHLEGFGTADGATEILTLASLLVPASVAIWAAGPRRTGPGPP